MKTSWTRLLSKIQQEGMSERYIEERFNSAFCAHHKQACELIFDKKGNPMAAIYFTPQALHKREFKNILRRAQEDTLYANEFDCGQE